MLFPTTSSLADWWDGIGSQQEYDLTECSTFIRVVDLPQAPQTYTSFILQVTVGNAVAFLVSTSETKATVTKDGTQLSIASAAHDPALHAWLRLRHSGNTIHWETSSNGQIWTSFTSLQAPFDVTALTVIIGVGSSVAQSTAGVSASFDNLDVPP
jgi:hypothetical protein